MYACGITPYDYAHIGHARSAIAWDILRRYIIYKGYTVKYIQNFTDIDDKIIQKAKETDEDPLKLSLRYSKAYLEDMEKLNILPATYNPYVTDYIWEIKRFIQKLIDKEYAYITEDGIYFKLSKFPNYGKLSNRQGIQGKDFALWKFTEEDPAWETQWGKKGRPGWHIECSTLINHFFDGETIDIHAGGSDLKFPHHDNEIAQSEALMGKPLANYWLHNGMVLVEGKKMSKSLGNFILIRDVLNDYHPQSLRLLFLQSHYRKPINISDRSLDSAQSAYLKLQKASQFESNLNKAAIKEFESYLNDDLNTAKAIALLFRLAKEKDGTTIKYLSEILGLTY